MTRKSKSKEDAEVLFQTMRKIFEDSRFNKVEEEFLVDIFKLKLIEQAVKWGTKYDELLGINKKPSKTPYPTPIYDFIRTCSTGFTACGSKGGKGISSLKYIKLIKGERKGENYFDLKIPVSKWDKAKVIEYYPIFMGKVKKKSEKIPDKYLRRSCAKVWSNARKRYPFVSLNKFVEIYKETLDKLTLNESQKGNNK